MATRKEMFEMWKTLKISVSISYALTIPTLILTWYIEYRIFFWILLILEVITCFSIVIKISNIEKKLKIKDEV